MKKHFLLLLLCIAASIITQAQAEPLARDSIKKVIAEIIASTNYTRVPIGDYEKEIQKGIDAAVDSRFNKIYFIGGAIILFVGGLIALNFNRIVNNETKKEVEARLEDLNERIDKQIKIFFFDNYKDINEKEITQIKEEVNGQVTRISKALDFVNEKLPAIRKMFINARMENIKTNRSKVTEADFKELTSHLKEAEELQSPELISKIINELSYVSYYLRKDKELESLVSQYAEKVTLKMEPTAYVNTALVVMNSYQTTGDLSDRQKAETYLNLSLKELPDYGEAFAMKLELLMTDYDKAITIEQREAIKEQTKNLIRQICRSEVAAKEAITRFERVQNSKAKSVYIDMLYQHFATAMKEMMVAAKLPAATNT
jgi:hypothetical protein